VTVSCITGNGLKTTDALAGKYEVERAIRPRMAEFEEFVAQHEVRGVAVDEVVTGALAGGEHVR
jgi:threonine synthase